MRGEEVSNQTSAISHQPSAVSLLLAPTPHLCDEAEVGRVGAVVGSAGLVLVLERLGVPIGRLQGGARV